MNNLPESVKIELNRNLKIMNSPELVESIKSIVNSISYESTIKDMVSSLSTINSELLDTMNSSIRSSLKAIESINFDMSKHYQEMLQCMNTSFSNLVIDSSIIKSQMITNGSSQIPIEQTINVVALKKMFSDISFDECAEFCNYISKYPTLSYKNDVGKRIYDLIQDCELKEIVNERIFRVRKHENGKRIPYTENEMFQPPFKITSQQRFSGIGQNYLYTSTNLEIAKKEVELTIDDLYTWIELQLKSTFKMLDICDNNIPLFDFCHEPRNEKKSMLNIEYLLPNYIADCSKQCEYDGIIYRSVYDKETINMVFFSGKSYDFKVVEIKSGKKT